MDLTKTSEQMPRQSQEAASEGPYFLDVALASSNPACHKKVLDTCRKILVRYPALIEEAAQDTWVRAMRAKSKKPINSPIAFLLHISRLAALDALRAHRPLGIKFESDSLQNNEIQHDPYQEIIGMRPAEFERGVEEILSILGPTHKTIFKLHFLDQYSQKQIADILNYSEAKISKEMAAMKAIILEMLNPDGPDDGGNGATRAKTRSKTNSREVRKVAAPTRKLSRSASKLARCLLEMSPIIEFREKERERENKTVTSFTRVTPISVENETFTTEKFNEEVCVHFEWKEWYPITSCLAFQLHELTAERDFECDISIFDILRSEHLLFIPSFSEACVYYREACVYHRIEKNRILTLAIQTTEPIQLKGSNEFIGGWVELADFCPSKLN